MEKRLNGTVDMQLLHVISLICFVKAAAMRFIYAVFYINDNPKTIVSQAAPQDEENAPTERINFDSFVKLSHARFIENSVHLSRFHAAYQTKARDTQPNM
jgi:hypothetical protein